jgi:hypothetical protein
MVALEEGRNRMTTFIANSLKTTLAGVAAVGLALAAPAAMASTDHFTFIGAPSRADGDHPLAEAQAYIARSVKAGTPMPLARKIVAKTGAYCKPSRRGEGVVDCTAETFRRVPGAFNDVVWTVRLVPAADGTVTSATVSRQ